MREAFVWVELMTTDLGAAESFYASVLGWQASDSGLEGPRYSLHAVDGVNVAGMFERPAALAAAGIGPRWTGYLGSAGVEADTARAVAAGATLRHGPEDIPGTGRFALLTDPQGAGFALFRPLPQVTAPPLPPGRAGTLGWSELHTGDAESALAFYRDLVGWTEAATIDMGGMGVYRTFGAGGAEQVGGMMGGAGGRAHWLFYFLVASITAASAAVGAGGGTVEGEAQEVPGGMWVLRCHDPQGTRFAVVSRVR